jgi:hypothetical protein
MPDTPPPRDEADAKAWFYLDHWRDIEEWAALRQEARLLLNRHLLDLSSCFEQLTAELDAEEASDLEDDNWRWLGLRRRSWRRTGIQNASIGLQWYPEKLFAPGDANEWPFIAVYVEAEDEGHEVRRAITNELAGARSRLAGRQTTNYPLWRYVRPTDRAPSVDPYELAQGALASFRELWEAAEPILNAALVPTAGQS